MSGVTENVQVIARVRPFNQTEISQNYRSVVAVDSVSRSITLKAPSSTSDGPVKTFSFDHVFGDSSKQLDVYNQVARPIVEYVMQGYNGTIFAYGQTGTGKTFTMEGDRSAAQLKGLIPNSFAHIFGQIAKSDGKSTFLVRVSYLEIYNEEVRDLLAKDQGKRLEIRERPDIGAYVPGLSTFVANTADDMDKVMTLGNRSRSVGATLMNEQSSRSHAIFIVTVECSEEDSSGIRHVTVGKLNLVDLAGSERQSKSGASGQRLKEAVKINLSLSTLGSVISALVDGRSAHVPYRNSKLTRLLQDSLGGNSKTVMVATVGPAEYNYDESLNTLRYATRAKKIQNSARINEDPKDALLRQFQQQIEELRRQLHETSGGSSGGESASAGSGDEGSSRRESGRRPSHAQLTEMRAQLMADRQRLEEESNMASEERERLQQQVLAHEKELARAKRTHGRLARKLNQLQSKIIVGGVNLLEKAAEQQQLLEQSAHQLQLRRSKEEQLREALKQKQAEREGMEERFSSLQEEAVSKTQKMRSVWKAVMEVTCELEDRRAEHQREKDALLDANREMSRELKLLQFTIDQTIPVHYQHVIEQNAEWSEEVGEWRLRGASLTGNSIIQSRDEPESAPREWQGAGSSVDLSHVYLSYCSSSGLSSSARPKSARVRTGRSQARGTVQ